MANALRPILLVEDDINDIHLASAALKSGNLVNPIVIAHDGVEALELLNAAIHEGSEANGPVVVLLDNKMPRMSGLELLERMKSDDRLKRIPIV